MIKLTYCLSKLEWLSSTWEPLRSTRPIPRFFVVASITIMGISLEVLPFLNLEYRTKCLLK